MEQNLHIKWYKCIDSTNTQAARELETAAEGTVWTADFQTAGRGQRGNKWESKEAENLTFTILFRPVFLHPAQQFCISQICSLGVCRYLRSKGLPAQIKWPNDIYVGNKKICGMLIENSIMGDKLSGSISGIGLNLNQTVFSSDAPNPTSLLLEFSSRQLLPDPPHTQSPGNGTDTPEEGFRFNRKEELSTLLGYIFTAYGELQDGFYKELDKEYTQNLYRLNEFHKFIEISNDADVNMPVEKIKDGKEITARIIGVDPYGCAILEHQNGTKKTYPFKGIRYVL